MSSVLRAVIVEMLTGLDFFDAAAVDRARDDASAHGSRTKLVGMQPQKFLFLALHGHDLTKEKRLADAVATGARFSSIPMLKVELRDDEKLQVIGHEGRHRMRLLRDRGISNAPVEIRAVNLRWGASQIPETIVSENGVIEYQTSQVFLSVEV